VDSVRRILILLALAGLLAVAANAVSPRGLSWTRPLGRGVGSQIVAAGLTPVDLNSMKDLVRRKSVLLVDARPPEEYRIGRLPGAVPSTPLPPRDKPIVVYCANEFCETALQLGEQLKKAGYKDVAVFVEGYEAWWNAGGAVDQD
jgi:rhodanese-related sulfurtransferase